MTFSDVLQDIKKLVGMELQSIHPGATITILDVDYGRSCLLIRTAQGRTRSRPFRELETIWNELNHSTAVHVEGVLHGSGTSRNQPETIFANLPYIEWLRFTNKKHIAFVGKPTHPFGTLKQMDPITAAEITKKTAGNCNNDKINMVVISANISDTISTLQESIPGNVSAIDKYTYVFENSSLEILVVSSNWTKLPVGSYTVVSAGSANVNQVVELSGCEYYVINEYGAKILVRKQ